MTGLGKGRAGHGLGTSMGRNWARTEHTLGTGMDGTRHELGTVTSRTGHETGHKTVHKLNTN